MNNTRIRSALALFILVTLAVVVTGCAGQPAPSGGSSGSAPAGGASAAVSMSGLAFDPPSVEVAVGGTVTWTNNDSVPHTVKIGDAISDSIAPGATYSKTFDTAGQFPYSCSIHPSMTGEVVVK